MIPYKDDNPTKSFPAVTILLIAANIFVFILQLMYSGNSERFVYSFGAIPHNIVTLNSVQPLHPILTIFTSMFMHGGFFHIFGNMLYLWIFGNNVEDTLGHYKFLLFYLFSGLAAAFAHIATNPLSDIPMVGASGAISGVLGAYAVLYPMAKIHTLIFLGFFITTVQIPALIVIGFWAIIQVVNGLVSTGIMQKGGVAWFAHIGGFAAGIVVIKLWARKRRIQQWS